MGKLYIVGTPIGNLKDITLRAIETLNSVDIILAEDTRQTLKLLNHLNIKKSLISYHRHNEDEKISQVKKLLDDGKNLALVSDAGMPVISDPGENLIKYLIDNNYEIEVIPGVTAITTAIVKSNLDSTRFTFEGFLSINKKQRNERLNELALEKRTMIFYEAPHKIKKTLEDLYKFFGDRKITIARELTKLHEEFIYTTLLKSLDIESFRGEIVLLIEGNYTNEVKEETFKSNVEMVNELISKGISKKEAIKGVAKLKKLTKNIVYKDYIENGGSYEE